MKENFDTNKYYESLKEIQIEELKWDFDQK